MWDFGIIKVVLGLNYKTNNMKRIVIILMVLAFSQTIKAQSSDDSVEITLSIQARDIEYISGFIFNNETYENLVDSIKPAYRKLVNPTPTTVVKITGYTKDFLEVLAMLRNDVVAIKNSSDTRIATLLSALNVLYINTRLTAWTDSDNSRFIYGRSAGKHRLTRKR